MFSIISRRTVIRHVERFPTEWALYREDEGEGERPLEQPEDVRPGTLEELEADLVHALQKSLHRLVGFHNAVSLEQTENFTQPELESRDIDLLLDRLRSPDETLQTFHE